MRITNINELETFIINSEVRPLRGKIAKEEYQILWRSTGQRAKEVWQDLINKNSKFYNKDKYLDIEYLSDKKQYRRIKLSKGRPKEEKTKDKRVTIRLDTELANILDDYCKKNNKSESEAIRKAIYNLQYKY